MKQCEMCREIMPADMFLPHVAAGCQGEWGLVRIDIHILTFCLLILFLMIFILVGVPESTVRCPLCQTVISPSDEETWKQHLMEDGGCPNNKKSLPSSTRPPQMTRSNTLQYSTSSSTTASTVTSPISRGTGRSASVSRSHSSAFVANSSPVSPSGSGPLDIPEYISQSRSTPSSSAAPEGTGQYSPPSIRYIQTIGSESGGSPSSPIHRYINTIGPDSGNPGSHPPPRFTDQESIHPLDPICPPIVVPSGPPSLSSSSSSSSFSIPHSTPGHPIGRGASASISISSTSNSSRIPKLGTTRSVSSNSCKLSIPSFPPSFLSTFPARVLTFLLFDALIPFSVNSDWLSLEVVSIKFLPSLFFQKKKKQ